MSSVLFLLTLSLSLTVGGCHTLSLTPHKESISEKLALNREGIEAFERKEYAEAEKLFREAIERDKNDITSQRYYAETLWALGKEEEAMRLLFALSRSNDVTEDTTAIHRSLAEKLLNKGNPVSALGHVQRVIDSSPHNPDAWILRGDIVCQLGKGEDAVSDYRRAARLAPDNQELLRRVAVLESNLGRYESSLAAWQRLGRTLPNGTEAEDVLRGEAYVCHQLGRFEDSIRNYERLLTLHPERADLYSLLAEVYLEQDNLPAAMEVTRQAEGRFPNHPEILELSSRVEQKRIARKSTKNPY